MKILANIKNIETTGTAFNIIGDYGFINDTFFEKKEYLVEEKTILERKNTLDYKEKDLTVGNLYERPDGSRFIYLGVKYVIEKSKKTDKNTFYKTTSLSNQKKKKVIYDFSYYSPRNVLSKIDYLVSKNFVILKDLGNNGILSQKEIEDKCNSIKNDFKYYHVSDKKDKTLTDSLNFKFIQSDIDEFDLKKKKLLIVKSNNRYYKYLRKSKITREEGVTGRPLKEVYFEFEVYQEVRIVDNKFVECSNFCHILLDSNSWYGSRDSFEISESIGKKYMRKRTSPLSIETNDSYILNFEI